MQRPLNTTLIALLVLFAPGCLTEVDELPFPTAGSNCMDSNSYEPGSPAADKCASSSAIAGIDCQTIRLTVQLPYEAVSQQNLPAPPQRTGPAGALANGWIFGVKCSNFEDNRTDAFVISTFEAIPQDDDSLRRAAQDSLAVANNGPVQGWFSGKHGLDVDGFDVVEVVEQDQPWAFSFEAFFYNWTQKFVYRVADGPVLEAPPPPQVLIVAGDHDGQGHWLEYEIEMRNCAVISAGIGTIEIQDRQVPALATYALRGSAEWSNCDGVVLREV